MNNKDKNETAEFLKPSKKWGALFAEVWGTFLLVLVGAGSVVVSKMTGEVSKGMEVVAPGLLVMAVIYFMGAVSGAHINPAVTVAFAFRRHFPWKKVPPFQTFNEQFFLLRFKTSCHFTHCRRRPLRGLDFSKPCIIALDEI